ncbi:MAG: thiamine biosynthesis protein ThiS [Omnitrophica WOR_2 bacterium RIFCSPHIGHO2_01_FULL_48_9]|nr:MAG: thiamine biosynthesis protein ThiS [Omnitrophica WOR_2 bacterium RIFCSPHIGHO2_02_FULL_48_11]OGX31606.1 MAG: thiamine biosynthesis protein ThiS [Omnitrophica WOR_2 bacterium RIFCSPHIGHO2_01_FULL_48_9]
MKITINGRLKEFSSAENLKTVIGQFSGGHTHVIAEVNGTVVKRPSWEQTAMREGDAIELVNLVGGG